MSDSIQTRVKSYEQGTVHTITVSHAARLNVLNSPIINAFRAALIAIEEDAQARVVVIDGAGDRAWIGGADIREMSELDSVTARRFITSLHELCQTLRRLRVPVVAKIDGYCLGAGLEVAACCDLRLASTRSTYAMPEVQIAIPSVIEAAVLPRLIGTGRARDLVMTGRTIDAWEAATWGLTETPVEPAQLDDLVNERLSQLIAADASALSTQKTLCNVWDEHSLSEAIEQGIESFANAYTDDRPNVRMKAFLNRKR